jgi:hypothetical protein
MAIFAGYFKSEVIDLDYSGDYTLRYCEKGGAEKWLK